MNKHILLNLGTANHLISYGYSYRHVHPQLSLVDNESYIIYSCIENEIPGKYFGNVV